MRRRTLHAILPLACMVATAVAFAATPGDPATTDAPEVAADLAAASRARRDEHA